MRLRLPGFLDHPHGIFRFARRDMGPGRQHSRRDQFGRQAVGLDRFFLCLDAGTVVDHLAGRRKRQNRFAPRIDILGQGPGFQLGAQRHPRPRPVARLRLQPQQHVLHLFVPRLQGKGLLRQLPRRVGVALGQLLLHDPAHAHKPGVRVFDKLLVRGGGFLGVPRQLCRLRGQEVGQLGLTQITFRLGRLGHGQTSFARGQRHHAFGQGAIALAFAVPREEPRNRRVVAVQELQHRHKQRHQLEQNPDSHHQHRDTDDRLQRREGVLRPGNGDLHTAIRFHQIASAQRQQTDDRDENQNFDQGPQHRDYLQLEV